MAEVVYTLVDFTSLTGPDPDEWDLDLAVRAAGGITTTFEGVLSYGTNDFRFIFSSAPSGAEITVLNGIVAAHGGLTALRDGGEKPSFVVVAAPPSAGDDEDAGFSMGSVWVDSANNDGYVLRDNTAGAAVWEQIDGAGSGITSSEHDELRQLIHFIDDGPANGFASGAYKEVLPSGSPFPTSIIWWNSAAKSKKLVEKTITRPTVAKPTPVMWEMYASDGSTVIATVTDTITYSGVFEVDRTRTIA